MERVSPDRGRYTQRELLPLLRVKPHVLRYWEQTLPLIRSSRDDAGRRIWTAGQVRMLMRIRHLVVERGVSVPAAGDALLREARDDSARVKAGLEGVRNALVVLLLKLNARNSPESGTVRSGSEAPVVPVDAGRRSDEVDAAVRVENLVNRGAIPPPPSFRDKESSRDRPLPALSLVPRGRGSADKGPTGRTVRFVYSHLFARDEAGAIAQDLARLVRYRLRQERSGAAGTTVPDENPESPLVVAAPAGEEAYYRRAFPEPVLVLPIPPLLHGGDLYRGATLSVIIAIAADRILDRYMQEVQGDTLYLWAPDNPSSPVVDYLSEAAIRRGGLSLGVGRTSTGYRVEESAALHLPLWRPRLDETLRCGRWVAGPGKMRFRLWLRDLARLEPPTVLVPDVPQPTVWRGTLWREQLRLVWSDIWSGSED